MATLQIWTLDDADETHQQVIAIIRSALGTAQEAEIASPEVIGALRAWCNSESRRMKEPVHHVNPETEVLASLRRSPYWTFWENLERDQEVRWTGTKNATYFVVDPNPVTQVPDSKYQGIGAYIELRRHTGKTFWTHIAQVRPLDR